MPRTSNSNSLAESSPSLDSMPFAVSSCLMKNIVNEPFLVVGMVIVVGVVVDVVVAVVIVCKLLLLPC